MPSGQPVTLAEVLLDEAPGQSGETWARFRFLAPQIARESGTVSYEAAAPDMDHLCGTIALPYLAEHGLSAARVVISLSDRMVPFGAQDPGRDPVLRGLPPRRRRLHVGGFLMVPQYLAGLGQDRRKSCGIAATAPSIAAICM